jgi:hypothetical protein
MSGFLLDTNIPSEMILLAAISEYCAPVRTYNRAS